MPRNRWAEDWNPVGILKGNGKRRQPEGRDTSVRGMRVRGMTLCRNASDFIPLTMIPLTELAVGHATGRADLSRRNQMKADGVLINLCRTLRF